MCTGWFVAGSNSTPMASNNKTKLVRVRCREGRFDDEEVVEEVVDGQDEEAPADLADEGGEPEEVPHRVPCPKRLPIQDVAAARVVHDSDRDGHLQRCKRNLSIRRLHVVGREVHSCQMALMTTGPLDQPGGHGTPDISIFRVRSSASLLKHSVWSSITRNFGFPCTSIP